MMLTNVSRPTHYRTRYKFDLTTRQREVMDLLARGHTNAEIAGRLGLTLDGAKWHVSEILSKLNVDSREEAAACWHDYNRPLARLGRALGGILGGVPLYKAAVATGGVVFTGAVAVATVLAVQGFGGGGDSNAAPNDEQVSICAPGDVRLALEQRVADGRVELVTTAVTTRPCSTEGDLVLRIEDQSGVVPGVDGHPADIRIRDQRTSGAAEDGPFQAVRVAFTVPATFANWCGDDAPFAARATYNGQVATVDLPDLPRCEDRSMPAYLRLGEDPPPPPTASNPALDRLEPVLAAVEARDAAQLASLASVVEAGCTTAMGLGGPPKCAEGQAEGTVVRVFPMGSCEGSYIAPAGLADFFANILTGQSPTLYAVTTVDQVSREPYYPLGDYNLFYDLGGRDNGVLLSVDGAGRVVNAWTGCGGNAEQMYEARQGPDVLVAPK